LFCSKAKGQGTKVLKDPHVPPQYSSSNCTDPEIFAAIDETPRQEHHIELIASTITACRHGCARLATDQ
jgi:hypothetical protein